MLFAVLASAVERVHGDFKPMELANTTSMHHLGMAGLAFTLRRIVQKIVSSRLLAAHTPTRGLNLKLPSSALCLFQQPLVGNSAGGERWKDSLTESKQAGKDAIKNSGMKPQLDQGVDGTGPNELKNNCEAEIGRLRLRCERQAGAIRFHM